MGKPKGIETPERLWQLFTEYKTHIHSNPRTIDKALQSGKIVQETLRVPLTMEGFELWCLEFASDCHHYFDNTDGRYSDYGTICSRVKKSIRQDQIEGGMVGQYNPSITQRLNGLTEKTDVTTGGDKLNQPVTVTIVNGNPSN